MVCVTCGREFKNEQGLAGHNLHNHGQPSERQRAMGGYVGVVEFVDSIKRQNESMTTVREAILDVSKRTLELLAQIQRLDGEIAELRQDPAQTKV